MVLARRVFSGLTPGRGIIALLLKNSEEETSCGMLLGRTPGRGGMRRQGNEDVVMLGGRVTRLVGQAWCLVIDARSCNYRLADGKEKREVLLRRAFAGLTPGRVVVAAAG